MSNTVKFIVKATVNPEGKEELATYLREVGILYKIANATPVAKYKVIKSLIGDEVPSLISIMEFASMEAINGMFESDAYKDLIPGRNKAFLKLEAYVGE